jgi:hypothetical protein
MISAMPPQPTIELVRRKCSSMEKDPGTALSDKALGEMLKKFPHNTQAPQVLLKVIALDQRYSTRIRYIDIDRFARHIATLGIDEHIRTGSLDSVELIRKCKKTRDYYSFATKFCSWHSPSVFPIYDRNVDECLWAYKQKDRFSNFRRSDLKNYKELVRVVDDFRCSYRLTQFSFRELDRFMWVIGDDIRREREAALLAARNSLPRAIRPV